jgi:hypothetical protein
MLCYNFVFFGLCRGVAIVFSCFSGHFKICLHLGVIIQCYVSMSLIQNWGENKFYYFHVSIATDLLKARIVESQEVAVARELHGKHVSAVMNTNATIEEL